MAERKNLQNILVIILIAMSLMGCINTDDRQYYNKEILKQGYDNETLGIIDECGKLDSYTYKDAKCYTNLSIQKRDSTICAWINDSYQRDYCFLDGVKLTLDPNVCDKVTRSYCDSRTGLGDYGCWSPRSDCYFTVATGLNRTDLCEKMVLDKWDCYLKVFENTGSNNASICEKIPSKYLMSVDCYTKAAINTGNLSICNSITTLSEGTDKTFPRDNCFLLVISAHLQEWKDNPLICEQIPYDRPKKRCNKKMANETKNTSWCDKNPPNTNSEYVIEGTRDDCYEQLGIDQNNLSMCDIINNKEEVFFCYSTISTNTRNISICDMIKCQDQDYCYIRDYCYFSSGACDKVDNLTVRIECYQKNGQPYDPKLCINVAKSHVLNDFEVGGDLNFSILRDYPGIVNFHTTDCYKKSQKSFEMAEVCNDVYSAVKEVCLSKGLAADECELIALDIMESCSNS